MSVFNYHYICKSACHCLLVVDHNKGFVCHSPCDERFPNRNGILQVVWISVRICLVLSEYKLCFVQRCMNSCQMTTDVSRCFSAHRCRYRFDC